MRFSQLTEAPAEARKLDPEDMTPEAPQTAPTAAPVSQAPVEPSNDDTPPPAAPEAPAAIAATGRDQPFVKKLQTVLTKNSMYLFGRKPNGLLTIPNLDRIAANLEKAFDQTLSGKGESTMEQQYEELRTNVELVAGGQSRTKALLITGAPSAGKTWNVMKMLKDMGQVEGKDFAVRRGKVTNTAVRRVLIEQTHGMVVFDDCDSVVADEDGENMMKIALDSEPIREIDDDSRDSLKTATLSFHEREEYTNALSNVLRNDYSEDDFVTIHTTLHRMRMLNRILRSFRKDQRQDKGADQSDPNYVATGGSQEDMILDYATMHLPNRFNFQGRIIFISNKLKKDWNSAILTRALHQDMNFHSGEMLDFITRIRNSIDTPGLTDPQKVEVLDYLRERFESGHLNTDINFRIVMQAWDLRMAPLWKQKIDRW